MTQLASWVEAFFIMNLFVLWFLLAFWILDLIIINGYLVFFPMNMTSKRKKHNCYTLQQLSLSKKLFVVLLSQNLEPLFWHDVVTNILSTRIAKKNHRMYMNMRQENRKVTRHNIRSNEQDNNDSDMEAISLN